MSKKQNQLSNNNQTENFDIMNHSISGVNIIYHSVGPGGGMERYVMDLIQGLLRKNIKVRVITRKLQWIGNIPNGLDFIVLNKFKALGSRIANLYFEEFSIREINALWPVISISRIPFISDIAISGGTHKYHLLAKKKKLFSFYHWKTTRNERLQYKNAKKVIAHSQFIANEISTGYEIQNDKIETLYPPIDKHHFSLLARERRSEIRKNWGVSDQDFLLIFPSNDHIRKGADLILKALEKSDPRIRLVVAGRKAIVNDRVINLGFQSDMAGVYAAGDAAILASVYEPFGLVGPESILCGTPAILADTIGSTEVLAEPACYKFPRSVDGLIQMFDRVLKLHDAGKLSLTDPKQYLNYDSDLDNHIDHLLNRLPKKEFKSIEQ